MVSILTFRHDIADMIAGGVEYRSALPAYQSEINLSFPEHAWLHYRSLVGETYHSSRFDPLPAMSQSTYASRAAPLYLPWGVDLRRKAVVFMLLLNDVLVRCNCFIELVHSL
jgi:hypothetical protein